jgi:dolichol-phosphate mannosyltransferase
MPGQRKKVAVMIPTYNESGSIEALIQEILALPLGYDLSIVVVDDNSPDGTGDVVARLGEKDTRVTLITRREKRGRGAAGIEGFKKCLSLEPDYVVEMDGDGSHQPRFIPLLLEQAQKDDLVLGSRYVKGGEDADRPLRRRFITFLVRYFIRRRFRLPVCDVSSGFRCFRREVLEKIDLDDMISVGPAVVLEILYKAHLLNVKISEVPIAFAGRKTGKTKLTVRILLETLLLTFKFKRIFQASTPKIES